MEPLYTYKNSDPSLKNCYTTQIPGDCTSGWLWFGWNALEDKLEPIEFGPMSYSLQKLMLEDLKDCEFLSEEEHALVRNGAELLLVAAWDRGDPSVGISGGFEIEIATHQGEPVYRMIEAMPNPLDEF